MHKREPKPIVLGVKPFALTFSIGHGPDKTGHGTITFIPSSTNPTEFGLAVFETLTHGFQVSDYKLEANSLEGIHLKVGLSRARPLVLSDGDSTILYDKMGGKVTGLTEKGKFSKVTGSISDDGQSGEDAWDASAGGGGEETPPHHHAAGA